jgi:hypothetical protein
VQDALLVDANDAVFKITGYSRAEVENRFLHWRTMTPPELVASSEEQLAAKAPLTQPRRSLRISCWLMARVCLGSGAVQNLCNLNGQVSDPKAAIRGVIGEENCRFRFRPGAEIPYSIN